METAIVSLICIALMVFGGMTMSRGFFTSVDSSATRLEEIGSRNEQIMRTELTPDSATLDGALDTLTVDLQNTGQTKLADFDKWDIIVQYYDASGTYHTRWLPYAAGGAGDNEWEVTWLGMNGEDEVFEPDVLNPGETMRLDAQLSPPAGVDTTNMVVVSTPNGVTASAAFAP
jgi:hypothetical protein